MSNPDYYQHLELEYSLALPLKSKAVRVGAQCGGYSVICSQALRAAQCCTWKEHWELVCSCLLYATWVGGVVRWWHWTVSEPQELSHSTRQSLIFFAWLFFRQALSWNYVHIPAQYTSRESFLIYRRIKGIWSLSLYT